ncbi:MAG: LEA type 2 family protein [Bacteroidetes bacterium]|nr:LEA type 2 family protein [Bacteroidota bacterium]
MRKLFGLFLIALVASCASPKDLEYQDVKNFSVSKISLNPEIGMDVQFYNPNKYGMTLKDANIDLYINDKLVGHAYTEDKYKVPAADTFLLPVKLAADLSGVLHNALQLMSNREVTVKLRGSVKAGKGVLVPIPINYEGKKKLNVF